MKKTHVKLITQVAMLIALQIVLSRFFSIKTESIRVGFGFVPMVLCGMLFGPYWAAIAYAVSDVLGAFLFDMGVFPGITLARIVSGLIYGILLHRQDVRFWKHIVPAVLLENIICSAGITTFFLALAYGNTFFAQFMIRLPQFPINIAVQLAVVPILMGLGKSLRKHDLAAAA